MSESPLPPEEASEGERSRRDGPVIRLLSLDGGGLRGVIQLRILMALEELTGRGAATLFDVIAGTSTGGVLALGLCRPGPDGKPALRAEDIYDRYIEYAPIIFVKPTVRSLPELVRSRKGRRAARQRVGALLDPGRYGNARHPADGLEALYRRFLGDARLSDAITDVIIPSYDWKAGRAVVFRSRAAARGEGMNPTMVEVSRATSAAPTYFPPVELMDDNGQEYVLIDGGVTANNPATIGYYEALAEEHLLGADADFLVVSMGTGRPPEEVPSYEELWSRGWLSVGMGMLHVILDGTSEIADAMMQVIIRAKEPHSRYYRFNTDLRGCSLHMDDARPENLAALTRLGDEIVRERRADLEALPERLVLDPWTRSV